MHKQLLALNPYNLAFAILTWIFILAALLTLTACTGSRLSMNAGCQNGYVGYGEKVNILKGHKR